MLKCILSHINSSATTLFAERETEECEEVTCVTLLWFWICLCSEGVNYFEALIFHVLGETDWNHLAIYFDSRTAVGCWCLYTGTWIRGRCWPQFLGGVFLVLFYLCFREAGIQCSYSFVWSYDISWSQVLDATKLGVCILQESRTTIIARTLSKFFVLYYYSALSEGSRTIWLMWRLSGFCTM